MPGELLIETSQSHLDGGDGCWNQFGSQARTRGSSRCYGAIEEGGRAALDRQRLARIKRRRTKSPPFDCVKWMGHPLWIRVGDEFSISLNNNRNHKFGWGCRVSAELIEREEILVPGACNHPNLLVLPFMLELSHLPLHADQELGQMVVTE